MSALVPFREQALDRLPSPGSITHTLDLSTPAGKRSLYRAIVGSEFTFQELAGQKISVQHVVVHYVPRIDEATGESHPGIRVCCIAPDGTRITGGSESVYRCLMLAASMSERNAPWEPPMSFVVVAERRVAGPGSWLWLDWVE